MIDKIKSGWHVSGIYNEACAAEGACPYYFGRDVAAGCRYFMVFRFKDARVNDLDLSGITVIYAGDIPHPSFAELIKLGSEGGVYISDNATPEQRRTLEPLVANSIGGVLMKKIHAINYVPIEIHDDGKTVEIQMPCGEMKQTLTQGLDGTPIRLENQVLPFLSNVKTCHSYYWKYEDLNKHFDYKDRCGVWADFVFNG